MKVVIVLAHMHNSMEHLYMHHILFLSIERLKTTHPDWSERVAGLVPWTVWIQ